MKLLDRIIKASLNEGDIVFDPFCGCATTCVAAQSLIRKWIGCDISPKAGELIQMRMKKELGLFFDGEISAKPPKRSEKERSENELFTDVKHLKYNDPMNKYHLYGKQDGICNGCAMEFRFETFEIDHIVPRSQNGSGERWIFRSWLLKRSNATRRRSFWC